MKKTFYFLIFLLVTITGCQAQKLGTDYLQNPKENSQYNYILPFQQSNDTIATKTRVTVATSAVRSALNDSSAINRARITDTAAALRAAINGISIGAGSVTGINLLSDTTLFTGNITYSQASGQWSGNLVTKSQPAFSVFRNGAASAAKPSFGQLSVKAIAATGSAYGGTLFLRDDGTWAAPPGNISITGNAVAVADAFGSLIASSVLSFDLLDFKNAHKSQALTDGATITMNWSLGHIGTVTIAGNRTVAFQNARAGYTAEIVCTQDATGNRNLTFPANTYIPLGYGTGTTLNLSTSAGATDTLFIEYDGTVYRVYLVKNFIH